MSTTSKDIEAIEPKVFVKKKKLPKAGLYLMKPHGELLIEGKELLIIHNTKISKANEPLYLLEEGTCWGVISLQEPQEISFAQCKELQNRHLITDKEFEEWGWKQNEPLFAYSFTILEKYDPPKAVSFPKESKFLLEGTSIRFLELKNLTMIEVLDYKELDLPDDLFLQLAEDLFRRGIFNSQALNLIRGWVDEYNVNKMTTAQLADDWRIVLGWYSQIKRGKKLVKRKGTETKELTLEDCKELGLKIFKEMVARDFKFSPLKEYKIYARELFSWIVSQYGKDKVPWKEEMAANSPKPIPKGVKFWPETYDPTTKSKKSLEKDWKQFFIWFIQTAKHKPIFVKKGETYTEITDDQIKARTLVLFKEMIKREFKFKMPNKYKGAAKVLFEWLVGEVGADKVPFKEVGGKRFTKLPFNPLNFTRADLEKITPVEVKIMSDAELLMVHRHLHEIYKEMKEITEPLQNAHIFVWNELKHRNLEHNIVDPLDKRTAINVEEYPSPEEGVPQQELSISQIEKLKLKEVLAAFPDTIEVGDPIHVYLCGRVVNEGEIPPDHDLDLLFKQGWYHEPTIKAFLDNVAQNNPEVAKRFHFVWDMKGPQIGFSVPLYRLAFIKVDPTEMARKSPYEFLTSDSPILFKPHIGIKPRSGFHKNEFFDPQELWDKWGKQYIDTGIIIQKKYDGMRFQIHCQDNKIKIFTEDRQRDRADVFKKSVDELLKHKKAESFIIDAEMVEYNCGNIKTKNLEMCNPLPREEMIKWIAAKPSNLDDTMVVFHVHDCVLLNGEALNMKGYRERSETISKIFPDTLEHWRKVPGAEADDMRRFFVLVKNYRSLHGSEGVVCKAVNSTYKIKYSGEVRASDWAKLKNLKEIDVMVWKVVQKKSATGKLLNQYLYESVFAVPCSEISKYREKDIVRKDGKCYLFIGRTYATSEHVSPGTIIVVHPVRVAEFEDPKGKLYYTWMFPLYEGKHAVKTEPDSIDVVKKLVAIGTGPGKVKLSKEVFDLPTCPFWKDEKICILKERFILPRDELSTSVSVQYLKFPILCRFANHYKCRFVKKYYYGYKTLELKGSPTDEDDLTLNGEED